MQTLRHWSVRHASALKRFYDAFAQFAPYLSRPLRWAGTRRMERVLRPLERASKQLLFDCKMCGQCVLSSTGMACPSNCAKLMRNGPCGGVRQDGGCEVHPAMQCVWIEAWRGGTRTAAGALPAAINAPVEHDRAGTSTWLRVAEGTHRPGVLAPAAPLRPAGSRLERLFERGDFVVTAEFSPPDSADPADVRVRLEPFRGYVDALNVTDASGANCHMSSLGVSVLLLQAGCEPVMQITCRDRNRIAIQGDILGAAALGIRNLLCLTGDSTVVGDHPDAKPVCDLDSMSLLQTARILRDEGRFLSGRKLSVSPRLFLGGADNPFAPPFDMRPMRLARKIAAGAQFIQTQYCFDLALLAAYMQRVRDEGLDERCRILIGVGPIASARTARWLKSKVPGVHIPDAVVARLEGAADARAEGRQICVETIQAIREIRGVAGVHIMAPRQDHLIPELVRASGVLVGRGPAQAFASEHDAAAAVPA